MAAILVHERGRMHEIEAETGEIQEIRRDITVAQRNIITLATLGEGVISYLAIHREMKRSGNERKKRESLITELQKSNDTNEKLIKLRRNLKCFTYGYVAFYICG